MRAGSTLAFSEHLVEAESLSTQEISPETKGISTCHSLEVGSLKARDSKAPHYLCPFASQSMQLLLSRSLTSCD